MKYKLVVEGHLEFGTLGLTVEGFRVHDDQEYFQPGDGLVVAHDLLEHPVRRHPNPYIDELLALGGVIWVRGEHGWLNQYGRPIGSSDFGSDIDMLVSASSWDDDWQIESPGIVRTRNDELRDIITDSLSYARELLESEYDEKIEMNERDIRAWITRGYQTTNRRYRSLGLRPIQVQSLFYQIQQECDDFLRHSEEGRRALLSICLSDCRCYLEEVYSDEYY